MIQKEQATDHVHAIDCASVALLEFGRRSVLAKHRLDPPMARTLEQQRTAKLPAVLQHTSSVSVGSLVSHVSLHPLQIEFALSSSSFGSSLVFPVQNWYRMVSHDVHDLLSRVVTRNCRILVQHLYIFCDLDVVGIVKRPVVGRINTAMMVAAVATLSAPLRARVLQSAGSVVKVRTWQ